MSTTQDQIKKVSEKLSKIPLSKKIGWDTEGILEYVNLLDEVDTTGVEPTISVVSQWTPFREDVEVEKEVLPKDLLACSNQKVFANQIIIPNIMN